MRPPAPGRLDRRMLEAIFFKEPALLPDLLAAFLRVRQRRPPRRRQAKGLGMGADALGADLRHRG